ncbi:MAG: class I SAM-dependent methyltransferase, partial [candidate division Zixibacteria bacterium]|nr:class I SAM-dependent methyltransferase [candidate division Zixibacteria bacterium]
MIELEYNIDSVLDRFGAEKWLDRYWAILSQENQKVNLVSRETDLPRFRRLVAEALLPFTQIERNFDSYLDIGSGGGIPSIPLLLAGIATGEAELFERTKKKTVPLAGILRTLGLTSATIVPESFGERAIGRSFSLVTLSYVTLTPTLFDSIRAHLKDGGVLVYYSHPEFAAQILKVQLFSYAHFG